MAGPENPSGFTPPDQPTSTWRGGGQPSPPVDRQQSPGTPPAPPKTYRRRVIVAWAIGAAILGLIIGAAAGGTEDSKTKTVTQAAAGGNAQTVTITTPTKTRTVTKVQTKVKTVKAAAKPPAADPPSASKSFSGNGGKTLPPVTIEEPSTLKWTNDGALFQLFDSGFGVSVNSQAHSGETYVDPGTYKLDVNAVGNWTIEFVAA
jgi:hypothetical protein